MKVIALVGKSGTGKSHKAHIVARQYGAELIIDDGLLIHGNRVVAGFSAKREETMIGAIRRAIFQDPAHAREVRDKLAEVNAGKVLVIGTSEKMVRAICRALELPAPETVVHIEDVSTPKEIERAQRIRKLDGKHVIPVPTLEIKKYFSGYLLDPLKIFYRRGKQEIITEKSVVRPNYSYLGRYTIADTVVSQIALYSARSVGGVGPGGRAIIENHGTGVAIVLELSVEYGVPLVPLLEKVQAEVAKQVEHMTALNVLRVDVTAKRLYFKKEK
ncbi:Asp23/Gls24 family envelope stress response protein [Thermosediminibacter litoriperuensis]|uniref:Putative alkaline shock family protein YloU n=1 Tax=Thermosediminibacter litoriperuensis TaxID=291989 RepID=A0A5S5AQ17_9FIRM|nr:Asp23/Gls24 family envelope stress response protein [Thermosediminibacter litoriperuensis]TYP52443.1 putative alkaline shock family protein YloU [Thermosediminibacter litoriperuensis]